MNRRELVGIYLAVVAAPAKPKKAWLAEYLPLVDGETGPITITVYADTYTEAHQLHWKYKPEHYYLSALRERV